MFNEGMFIQESNLIDPQYDNDNQLIRGDFPGTIMFNNQLRALEIFPQLIEKRPTPIDLPLYLHRELTRGIDVYEHRGMSGKYRNCDVYIGGQKAPPIWSAIEIIETILTPKIEETRNNQLDIDEALAFAWWCHNLFECCHPFIDGNGRTGRLLLNLILEMLGHDKIIIYYSERFDYYAKIQKFRDTEFLEIIQKMH